MVKVSRLTDAPLKSRLGPVVIKLPRREVGEESSFKELMEL